MHRKLLLLPQLLVFVLLFWSTGASGQCSISGVPAVCKDAVTTYSATSPQTGLTYQWSMSPILGAFSSPFGSSTSVLWSSTGNTVITVQARNSSGAVVSTCTYNVNVGAIPQPVITATTQVGCLALPPKPREGQDPNQFDDGCIKACEGSAVTYTTNGPASSSYVWTATGGTVYPAGNSCTVVWGAQGQGSLTVTQTTNPNGCTGTKTICIEIIPKPHADFGALPDTSRDHIEVCMNDSIQFVQNSYAVGTSPLINWYWDFGDGTTFSSSTPTNPTHHYTSPGGYDAYLVVRNACNCTDTAWMRIEVRDGEGVKFLCYGAACEKDKASYTVDLSNINCSGFPWSVIGGSISGGTTSTVDVVWDNVDTSGFGYVSFDGNYCDGPNHCPGITTIKVPVIQINGHISGPDVVCLNSNSLYRLPAWPGVKFNWSVSGPATITPTDQPNEILVNTYGGTGTVYLHCDYEHSILGCRGRADKAILIRPGATISSTATVACHGASGTYNLVGAATGTWIVTPPGSAPLPPTTGPSVTVNYTQVGVYTVSVSGTTFCPPDPFVTTVYPRPPRPNTITGPDTVCSGNTYTFSAGGAQNGTVFVWSILSGSATFAGSNSGANVSVLFNGSGPWTIAVRRKMMANPNCESENIAKTIYPPQVNVVVAGEDEPCPNSYAVYTAGYLQGETYEWGVTSNQGSVSSGDGTPNATILWNNTSGFAQVWVRVRKCRSYFTDTMNVNIGALPTLTLTQSSPQVCRDEPLSLTLTNIGSVGFTSGTITWDFGDGSTATSNINSLTPSITVQHPYTALNQTVYTYQITVTITNVNGCPGATLIYDASVDVRPAPVAWVTPTGPIGLCNPVVWPDLTADLQTGFVPTVEFRWLNTSNVLLANCLIPNLPACNPFTAPGYGSYYVVAVGDNGCTDTSNIVSIFNNCGGGGCAIVPNPIVDIDTPLPADCGNVVLNANFSSPGYSPSWTWPSIATGVMSGTNSLSATIPLAGVYNFGYSVQYNDSNGQPCTMHASEDVLVPLIPRMLTSLTCKGDNSGYVLTLYDNSHQYPSVTVNSRNFMVDNVVLQTGPGNTFNINTLTPGPHTVALVMVHSYTWQGVTYNNVTCTTAIQTITVPNLPHATFTTTINNNCVQVPVHFNSSSMPTGVYHAWQFGDGTGVLGVEDPQREYASAGTKPVGLTVTDQFGCTDDTTVPITVFTNNLGGSSAVAPANICEGGAATLSFTTTSGSPTSYQWMNGNTTYFTTTSSSIGVSNNGSYWVHVTDANSCFLYTQASPLSVTSVPEPIISGSTSQCVGAAFTLDGYAGPGPGISYSWTENGLSFTGSTQASITRSGLAPGTYTYVLRITVGGCTRQSAPFVVTVHPTPAKPTLSFDIIDCPTYLVELQAGLPGPGTVTWSHGTSGTPTYANEGGLYKAWYTNQYGCQSSDSIEVPKDPAGYLWVFPTGCYNKCPNPTFTIYGPIIPFERWEYNDAGSVINTGGPGFVPPLVISSSGQYGMTLSNGWCEASIGTLNLTVPDDCPKSQPCRISFEPQVNGVHYTPSCNAYLDLSMYNSYGANVTVQIIPMSPGGTMTPSSFVLTPGGNPSIVSQWTPPAPFTGNAVFMLLFTLPDGTVYSQEIYVYDIKCPYGNGYVYRKAAPDAGPSLAPVENVVLTVVPNPAQDATTVQYRFGASSTKRAVQVYDVTGRLMATLDNADGTGQWPIKLDNWAAGVYQVVLKADGKVVATSRLSVTH